MKNESELSAFLVIEYDYDTCDAIIVVVAKDENEAKKIAVKNYGMIDVDIIEEIVAKNKGYYEIGNYYDQSIDFYNI